MWNDDANDWANQMKGRKSENETKRKSYGRSNGNSNITIERIRGRESKKRANDVTRSLTTQTNKNAFASTVRTKKLTRTN